MKQGQQLRKQQAELLPGQNSLIISSATCFRNFYSYPLLGGIMRYLAALAALLLFVSCAQVPKEESYPLAFQKKLQASDHWYQLCYKIANDWSQLAKESGKPLYISGQDKSPFGRAMKTLLTTEFFNNGVKITTMETSPLFLEWEVQTVFHAASRKNDPGLVQFILLEVPQALIFGESDTLKSKSHYEVIVTFNLISNDALYARRSAIFYVNDGDILHYKSFSHQNRPGPALSHISYSIVNK